MTIQNAFAAALGLSAVLLSGIAPGQTTTRESVSSSGVAGNRDSNRPAISADGRFVAFTSVATNLVSGDGNNRQDVFLRDRQAATTVVVSVSGGGALGNHASESPSISGDGRYVAFVSTASNLVMGDSNAAPDVFVRDTDAQNPRTIRVSLAPPNTQANGYCRNSVISATGRFVAFASDATNLVPGDNNNRADVFVHDRDPDGNGVFDEGNFQITRASVDDFGLEANDTCGQWGLDISADGRFVAFSSEASNLTASAVGNTHTDIFVRDLQAGTTQLASVSSLGNPGDSYSRFPSISDDGRYVAFMSAAANLVGDDTNLVEDVFVHDLRTGSTTRISVAADGAQANGSSTLPSMAPDGRYVAFQSAASNLGPGDSNGVADVFVHNLISRQITRVSVSSGGTVQGNQASGNASLAASGRHIAFDSLASNLVASDTNAASDVFVHDALVVTVIRVSPPDGSENGGDLVRVHGIDFTTIGDTTLAFGGVSASLLEVNPSVILARTPPGAVTVDVTVTNSNGTGLLPAGYRYVAPEIAARYGNVNIGTGDRQDLLLVNATPGDPLLREVTLGIGQPISIVMLAPEDPSSARFVLYAWGGVANASTLTPLPRGIGLMIARPPFIMSGTPGPAVIWNNLGFRQTLGTPTFPSSPAPSTVFSRPGGSPSRTNVSIQGIIQDNHSQIAERFSLTNAVILRIR